MVSVASHLSKAPLIATEAFTKNLMLLFSGVTAKTGASARLSNGRAADSIRGNYLSYDRLADVDISRARRVRWSKCKTIASKTKKLGFSAGGRGAVSWSAGS